MHRISHIPMTSGDDVNRFSWGKHFVYQDDILVDDKTIAEHIGNLRKVLTQVKNAGLCLTPSEHHLAKRESVLGLWSIF